MWLSSCLLVRLPLSETSHHYSFHKVAIALDTELYNTTERCDAIGGEKTKGKQKYRRRENKYMIFMATIWTSRRGFF